MKTARILSTVTILSISLHLFADGVSYNGVLTIKAESEKYIVIHHHDWSSRTHDARYKMISTNQDPFTKENDYSFIVCLRRSTGDTIFKHPCPAMTFIAISPDENFIIGISKIKLLNPYQLVIFDVKGNLIKKRNFSYQEAKLSATEFNAFKNRFPSKAKYLESIGHIYKVGNDFYIDSYCMGMPDKLGRTYRFLFNYRTYNHLSKNFSESVTNWIYWYFDQAPEIQFHYNASELTLISILDPQKVRFSVNISENYCW